MTLNQDDCDLIVAMFWKEFFMVAYERYSCND